MMKLALVKMRNYINTHKLPIKIVGQVHDEASCEVPDELTEQWARIQERLMLEAGAEIIKDIPMTSDATITQEWQK